MEDVLVPVMVVGMLFVALPWLVLHYVTRWKTAATLTNDDERMLGDMHELARRLEDRLDTVERLVAQENPEWQPRRIELDTPNFDPENVRKLERNR
ncbi:envelope stress response membrane protein PspB [Sphingorhabdus sp.]|uniref:envelope stress response membrane protein PspB n=1 Tax=Sphingorhabdus sp. TaxID=1902408 RepID=UPI003983BDC5